MVSLGFWRRDEGKSEGCKPVEVRRGERRVENPDDASIDRVGSVLPAGESRVQLRVVPPLMQMVLQFFLACSVVSHEMDFAANRDDHHGFTFTFWMIFIG